MPFGPGPDGFARLLSSKQTQASEQERRLGYDANSTCIGTDHATDILKEFV